MARIGRKGKKQLTMKIQDRLKAAYLKLAKTRDYGPRAMPVEAVLAVLQEDAEASGHKLGKGWEERARGYIEIDIRAGYLRRQPDGHVSVTEKARDLARELKREMRQQEFSTPEHQKVEFAKRYGQITGPNERKTRAQLWRQIESLEEEIDKHNGVRQAPPPLQQWSSISTISDAEESLHDEDAEMELDVAQESSLDPVTPLARRHVRFGVADCIIPYPTQAYPSPDSLPRHRAFTPGPVDHPTTPSRIPSGTSAMLHASPFIVPAPGEAGPSRFMDQAGPSNALLSDFGVDPIGSETGDFHEDADDDDDIAMVMDDDHAALPSHDHRDEKIAGLESENAGLRTENTELHTEISSLKSRNVELESQNASLVEQLRENQVLLVKANEEIARRVEDQRITEERIRELEATKTDKMAEIGSLLLRNSAIATEILESKDGYKRLEKEIGDISTQKEKLKQDLEECDEKLVEETKRSAELLLLLHNAEDSLRELNRQNADLNRELERQERITELDDDYDELLDIQDTQEDQIEDLGLALRRSRKDTKIVTREKEELECQVEDLTNTRYELWVEINEERSKRRQAEDERTQAQNECREAQSKCRRYADTMMNVLGYFFG